MDRPTDFRFLQSAELDGLSLDEKLAYVDVLCAEFMGDGCRTDAGGLSPVLPHTESRPLPTIRRVK